MPGLAVQLDGVGLTSAQGVRLLSGISFTVEAGQCCAVVGPNGAGKSSLLGVMAGRIPHTAGSVQLGEPWVPAGGSNAKKPVAQQAQRALDMAVVGQTEQTDVRLLVGDYVALGRIPHQGRCSARDHQEAVSHALTLCGLRDFAQRGLHTLSGGERQRAHLARALAQAPSVLLLDEPTNHLDLRARLELLDLVQGLGITVVMVLHELSLVPSYCDRVLVLNKGRMAAYGCPHLALSAPLVADVFGMSLVHARHPTEDRSLWFFDRHAA